MEYELYGYLDRRGSARAGRDLLLHLVGRSTMEAKQNKNRTLVTDWSQNENAPTKQAFIVTILLAKLYFIGFH